MSNSSSSIPPWSVNTPFNLAHARVLAAIHRRATQLLVQAPNLPVPGAHLSGFINIGPFTVRGVLGLWRDVPKWFTGTCPLCFGMIRGTGGGGLFSIGGVTGRCLSCGLTAGRTTTSFAPVVQAVPKWVLDQAWQREPTVTPIFPDDPELGGSIITPGTASWEPLLIVLRRMGEKGLRVPKH